MGLKRASKKRNNFKPTYEPTNVVNFKPIQKKTTVDIIPRNRNQELYTLKLLAPEKDIVFGIGPAGTGKTLLAVQVAVKLFKEGQVDKIIVTRPAVSVDEDLGFLPGTLEQKMAPWTIPVMSIIKEYFSSRDIEGMLQEGIIEIAPLAYMRGRTFRNSYIIADECQLTTPSQMKMLLTRLGENSKLVVTGDLEQADRGQNNGLIEFLKLYDNRNSERISIIHFNISDVERHPAVKEILDIYK
jgi:phosphate starvation-inducible protein PhoH and related proteins